MDLVFACPSDIQNIRNQRLKDIRFDLILGLMTPAQNT